MVVTGEPPEEELELLDEELAPPEDELLDEELLDEELTPPDDELELLEDDELELLLEDEESLLLSLLPQAARIRQLTKAATVSPRSTIFLLAMLLLPS